ncbi:MAG: putative two-component sensor histidine kinase [Clostridia bacterium]|jgi:two-component system sensor histidine kinase YesM|nr:putative two-component sensor histidine kinase [Clostridia bacterium]
MFKLNLFSKIKYFITALFQPYRAKSIKFLITTYFTIITVSVVFMISVILYNKFSSSAKNTAASNTQQILEQVSLNVEFYLKGMSEVLNLVSTKILTSSSLENYKLKEQLYTILGTREDVVSISVFTDQGELISVVPSMEMRNNSKPASQSWFNMALANHNTISISPPHIQNLFKGEYKWVVSLSKMLNIGVNYNKTPSVLLVDVNFKTIDDLCQRVNLGSKGYIYIIDSDGNIIYHPQQQLIYIGLKNEDTHRILKLSDGSYLEHSAGEERLTTIRTIHDTNWKIIAVSYLSEIVATKNEIGIFVLWLLIIVIVLTFLLTAFTSSKISRPIEDLEKSIEMIENEDFHTIIDVHGPNEVVHLSRRFNLMVVKIRQLMDQIILEQELKRKHELDILQAQISPHFLYNTLNSVVRMIENQREDDAIKMIISLSKFFRISLSKGKNIISIQDELEHINNYLTIQKIRYKNKFEFEIEASEEILQYKTIKLILQPIVENALYHGIEYMDTEGLIKISASIVKDKILFEVKDNGLGISPDVLRNILSQEVKSKDGSGIGLKNVHERLNIGFGKEYGLEIESEADEGTNVKIWIPIIKEGE